MARAVGLPQGGPRMSGPGAPVADGAARERERGSTLSPPRPREVGALLRGLAIAVGLLAGYLGPRAAPLAAEPERCAGEGRHRLAGRLLGDGIGGEVTPLAGQDVVLWPADAYRRAVAAAVGRPWPRGELPPYARLARTDDRGEFRFDDLPPCRYLVLAKAPGSLASGLPLGGYAVLEVEVAEGGAAGPAVARSRPAPPQASLPRVAGAVHSTKVPPALPTAGGTDPCAPYARNPVQRLRCEWVTGPERDRYVPYLGRGAGLAARMDCLPDRDDPPRYAACLAEHAPVGTRVAAGP
jgi:hypothetical protein